MNSFSSSSSSSSNSSSTFTSFYIKKDTNNTHNTHNTHNTNYTNYTNYNNLMYKLSFINNELHKLEEENCYSEFSLELYLEYNKQIKTILNNIQELVQHT